MKHYILIIASCLLVLTCSEDQDDVTNTVNQCLKPTEVSSNNITHHSVEINWIDSNNAANYTAEFGQTGFTVGSGTEVTSTEPTVTLNNLQAGTTYDVFIKTTCSTDNTSMFSDIISFTTAAPLVIPDFLTNLSDLNLFSGNLNDLTPSQHAFEYDINTPLFTDYAHKQRLVALPPGTSMSFVDNDFPNFPDGTLISKTFFYYNDESNHALGKTILETRILIKINGNWELGNYKWNSNQTDAVLDNSSHTVPVSFVNNQGVTNTINYKIPGMTDCLICHTNNTTITPIGPKLRSMNFNNQLQDFINAGYLSNITDPSNISALPNWEDTTYSLEQRARAYFDMNCAHCHSEGGFCELQSDLRLTYEIPFSDTKIFEKQVDIDSRMRSYNEGFSMPLTGTSIIHDEGYSLIRAYINSL
ncbi:fibronectin type III domain-containing protein [Bizionia sp. KMM 8389]